MAWENDLRSLSLSDIESKDLTHIIESTELPASSLTPTATPTSSPPLDLLPTEIITQIYLSLPTLPSCLALARTCHRLSAIFSSRKLAILERAAEAQYGPLPDLTQLLTHNASQPPHVPRATPFSLALLAQIAATGTVAEKWATLYPFKKWKLNPASRRLLTPEERRRVRAAVYRLWLYTRAFHTRSTPRERRMAPEAVAARARLLHNYSTAELADMADVQGVVREVVQGNVCPSNGAVARKVRRRWGDEGARSVLFGFNIHLNYPAPAGPGAGFPADGFGQRGVTDEREGFFASHYFHSSAVRRARAAKYALSGESDPGGEGWGDEVGHYYVVEDMLKLDPGQIMWLKEHAPRRAMVEGFVRGLGEWFENNGQTFGGTLDPTATPSVCCGTKGFEE
ncbi:hypothetical protein EJ06DRAFT_546573 [Trichodelitschia bisporula]|uniref:F-box domain-containing protein n=1 Tax=Trichodelitschia bisporula TaxID=703511 RepID=A0A6G1I936_9PEZI|nr:hypothetical protein EJ06DRAFT_546573 [Trichodelitschia bisporula]